jgi:hypothetical protein
MTKPKMPALLFPRYYRKDSKRRVVRKPQVSGQIPLNTANTEHFAKTCSKTSRVVEQVQYLQVKQCVICYAVLSIPYRLGKPGVPFIRKSGLIPRSSAAAEITHHLQKFDIKPDGINRTGGPQFPIERTSAKQSGTKDTVGLTPRRLILFQ